MYPQLIIHKEKIQGNLEAMVKIVKEEGKLKTLSIVTKGVCADSEIVDIIINHPGVDYLADSRIMNIKTYVDKAHEKGKKTLLLRIPMQSEVEDVAKYVDICQISEISTIRLLNEEAKKLGKVQDIVLMIDMGDLREGLFFREKEKIHETVSEILKLENINLMGVAVNLTCYGAIIPKNDNLSDFVQVAREIESSHGITLDMISGGNSSSIYLIGKNELPEGINNLRLGEAFLLGNDTAYETKLPGTTGDAFILRAEVVELQEKPSLPIGEVGVDAFGQKPYYEDRGMMMRAIIAIGKQDTDIDSMTPVDDEIEIMGGSSDHIILDVTKCPERYQVGSTVDFTLGYGGMLKTTTSPYIVRVYR